MKHRKTRKRGGVTIYPIDKELEKVINNIDSNRLSGLQYSFDAEKGDIFNFRDFKNKYNTVKLSLLSLPSGEGAQKTAALRNWWNYEFQPVWSEYARLHNISDRGGKRRKTRRDVKRS